MLDKQKLKSLDLAELCRGFSDTEQLLISRLQLLDKGLSVLTRQREEGLTITGWPRCEGLHLVCTLPHLIFVTASSSFYR